MPKPDDYSPLRTRAGHAAKLCPPDFPDIPQIRVPRVAAASSAFGDARRGCGATLGPARIGGSEGSRDADWPTQYPTSRVALGMRFCQGRQFQPANSAGRLL